MGYVPPDAPFTHPRLGQCGDPLPDFGQQWIGRRPHSEPPATPYRRYLWDLYGEPGRDWMPLWSAVLIVAIIALVVAIALAVLR